MKLKDTLIYLGIKRDKLFTGPKHVILQITNRCNFECLYCWYHSKLLKKKPNLKEIPLEKLKEIINDLAELNVERITISGEGEPFFHSQIKELLTYMKKFNFQIDIDTNLSFSKTLFSFLVGIHQLNINLSSPLKSTFLELQSNEQNFKKVMENIFLLSKLKKKIKKFPTLKLVCILTKINFRDLDSIFSFASRFNFDFVEFNLMNPSPFNKHLVISPSEASSIQEKIKDVKEKFKIKSNIDEIEKILEKGIFEVKDYFFPSTRGRRYRGIYYTTLHEKNFRCYAGWCYSLITTEGLVFPCCENESWVLGNIYEKSFKDIWFSKDYHNFRLQAKYNFDLNKKEWTECNHCPYVEVNKNLEIKSLKI